MTEKAVCFTGHRNIREEHHYRVMFLLRQCVEQKIKEGYAVFCSGGAVGFDTMAALTVLRLKNTYKNIQLHLYLPCKDQTAKWSREDKAMYEKIIRESDAVFYTQEKYTPSCMMQRNRALVNNSRICIAYCTQPKGGTAYTIGYAMDNGRQVINLAQLADEMTV